MKGDDLIVKLLPLLMAKIPVVLVYLVGGTAAVMKRRQQPQVAGWILAGCILGLLTTLVLDSFRLWLLFSQSGTRPEKTALMMAGALGFLSPVVWATSLACILMGAFARMRVEPSTLPAGSKPWPESRQ